MSEDYNDPGCAIEILAALAISAVFFVGAVVLLAWWLM